MKRKTEELFYDYLQEIIYDWSKTLTTLGYLLVPIFFILDIFVVSPDVLFQFFLYRLISTLIIFIQFLFLKMNRVKRFSSIHGFIVSIVLGIMISWLTVILGGFNSPYYAGLNLVIIGVNMLLPWGAFRSALSSLTIVGSYVVLNLIFPHQFQVTSLINNLFFLLSTAVMAVSISSLRFKLIRDEFYLRADLKKTRDALWGEMQIAKKIQMSLLPEDSVIDGYRFKGFMQPASEVGGDYYDFFKTSTSENWFAIGDVSGHGVDSGLIMMMVKTSIKSIVNKNSGLAPSEVLAQVNTVIRQNIINLQIDRFMTIFLLKFSKDKIILSGEHLDVAVYRAETNKLERYTTNGTWLCLIENIGDYLEDVEIPIYNNDLIILYTDGVIEAMNKDGEIFGEERLFKIIEENNTLSESEIIKKIKFEVEKYQVDQADDISLLLVRKIN